MNVPIQSCRCNTFTPVLKDISLHAVAKTVELICTMASEKVTCQ